MKIFSFIASIMAFIMSSIYLVIDNPEFDSLNSILYFSIQIILLIICITGIVINLPRSFKFAKKIKRTEKYDKIQA